MVFDRRLVNCLVALGMFATLQLGAVGTRVETTCGDQPTITYTHAPMPVKRVKPVYPTRAIIREISGFVTLSFRISKAGVPTTIEVLSSSPANMFDRSALSALAKWRFDPTVSSGTTTITYQTMGTAKCYIEDA